MRSATARARSSARSTGNDARSRCHYAAMALSTAVALVLVPLLKVPAWLPSLIEVHSPIAAGVATTAARNRGVGTSYAAAAMDLTRDLRASSRAQGRVGGEKLARSLANVGGGRRQMQHEAGATGEESVLKVRRDLGGLGRRDGESGSLGEDYPGDTGSVAEELELAGLDGADGGVGLRGEGSAVRSRDEHAGVVLDAGELMHVDGGGRERDMSDQTLEEEESFQERQPGEEEGTELAERGGGDSHELEDGLGGLSPGSSYDAHISYADEGGILKDGRNRCFWDNENHHRCYPTVFFFGTSKCGESDHMSYLSSLGCIFGRSGGVAVLPSCFGRCWEYRTVCAHVVEREESLLTRESTHTQLKHEGNTPVCLFRRHKFSSKTLLRGSIAKAWAGIRFRNRMRSSERFPSGLMIWWRIGCGWRKDTIPSKTVSCPFASWRYRNFPCE